ncbi:unnamed protein product, partial [Prorocentrum cordatum]
AQAGAGAAAGLLERAGGEEGAVEGEAPKATIFVCTNLQCCQDGAADTRTKMLEELAPPGVAVEEITCLGPCGSGPNVYATPLPAGGAAGGRAVDSLKRGSREYPGGVVFTAMKGEGDVGLLEPWGFEAAERTPLDWARLAVRNSQLDQVPWPILLYVGFNVARLVTNLLFHFDLLEVVKETRSRACARPGEGPAGAALRGTFFRRGLPPPPPPPPPPLPTMGECAAGCIESGLARRP